MGERWVGRKGNKGTRQVMERPPVMVLITETHGITNQFQVVYIYFFFLLYSVQINIRAFILPARS